MIFAKLGLALGLVGAMAVASAAHDGTKHVVGPADNYVYQLSAVAANLPVIKDAAGAVSMLVTLVPDTRCATCSQVTSPFSLSSIPAAATSVRLQQCVLRNCVTLQVQPAGTNCASSP